MGRPPKILFPFLKDGCTCTHLSESVDELNKYKKM